MICFLFFFSFPLLFPLLLSPSLPLPFPFLLPSFPSTFHTFPFPSETVLLYSPNWPQTCSSPPSVSLMLVSQRCSSIHMGHFLVLSIYLFIYLFIINSIYISIIGPSLHSSQSHPPPLTFSSFNRAGNWGDLCWVRTKKGGSTV